MIRIRFTHDDGTAVGLTGMRVMIMGGALLVDGRRVAHKRAWGGSGSHRWIDDLGRAWDTIEFLPVEPAEEESTDEAARLQDHARQIRDRAEAVRPRAVPSTKG